LPAIQRHESRGYPDAGNADGVPAEGGGDSGQRIHHLDPRKPVEVRVAGIDASDTVLAHQHGGVEVVGQISPQLGHLAEPSPQPDPLHQRPVPGVPPEGSEDGMGG
jgi:hypothetical protein